MTEKRVETMYEHKVWVVTVDIVVTRYILVIALVRGKLSFLLPFPCFQLVFNPIGVKSKSNQ